MIKLQFKITGPKALFTDPITKLSGEKTSYLIPTYSAIHQITKNIYWKPTLDWEIESIRIMNEIKFSSKGVLPLKYNGGNGLSIYTYLYDVEYQIQAKMIWNEYANEHEKDRNQKKHEAIAKRSLKIGGRLPIVLGVTECGCDVEECLFGEGEGFYDDSNEMPLGLMFHGYDFPDALGEGSLYKRFWNPVMKNGIINFPSPKECVKRIKI